MGIEAKISSKGQTTIPLEVRERLGLSIGDRIAFIEFEHGYLIVPRNRPANILFGALADYAMPDTSLADYDDAVGNGIGDHVDGSAEESSS